MTVSSSPNRKPLLAALAGIRQRRPPVWLMRQAGRYLPEYRELRRSVGSFLEMCYTPELAVEITLQPIRRYGFDAAILFSDILVVPDALGAEVRFVEGEGPRLKPLTSEAQLAALGFAKFDAHLAPVYATVRQLAVELPAEVTLIGFSGAPWTLAAYMIEGGGSKEFLAPRRMARRQPELFGQLIGLLSEAIIRYLSAQVEAGAEVIQLFDSWAGVLPEPEMRRWCIEPTQRIVRELGRDILTCRSSSSHAASARRMVRSSKKCPYRPSVSTLPYQLPGRRGTCGKSQAFAFRVISIR